MSESSGHPWQRLPLGKCCTIVSGSTPRRDTPEYWDGDILWATPKDISNLQGTILTSTADRITDQGLRSCSSQILPRGAILFSSRAPIGLIAVAGEPMCTNQGFKNLVPGPDVHSRYLYWTMKRLAPQIQDMGNGATFKEVSKSVIERVEIPLPPLAEQKRIAAILDKADAVRRQRHEVPILSRTAVRDFFLHLFGDPISNPNEWDTFELSEVTTVVTGNTPPRKEPANYGDGIEWIKSDNINTPDHFITEATERLSAEGEKKCRTVPPGATLVTCIAGTPDCIGNAALTNRRVAFNQQINAVVPGARLVDRFLYSMIFVLKPAVQQLSSKSMKGMVSKGRFETLRVIVPPLKLQHTFVAQFDILARLAQKMDAASQQADALFHSLVQRAFRGEL